LPWLACIDKSDLSRSSAASNKSIRIGRKRLHAAFDIPRDELFASVSDDREAILAAFEKRAAK
jgi:hypothetical protein